MSDSSLAVMVHGGAGRFSDELGQKKLPYLRQALDAAWNALLAREAGERAVAAALRVMEDCQYFNAGYGGYPNIHGIVLLDVGLMRGNGDFVSLINVRKVKYPSTIALDMLVPHQSLITLWTHELMTQVENGRDEIKERYGLVASHEELIAPFVRELLKNREFELSREPSGGTVGCVVRDGSGQVFAGTSTGGISLKNNGRIGDSPIIGDGVYADNELGALSTTGHGESFLKCNFSGYVLGEMRRALRENRDAFLKEPDRLSEILQREMNELERKAPGRGAIILIPARGEPQFAFNSERVSLGIRTGDRMQIVRDEAFIASRGGKLF